MNITDPATLPEAFEEALNSGDVEAALALVAPGGGAFTPSGAVVAGAALREFVSGVVAGRAHLRHRRRRSAVREDVALLVGDWALVYETEGRQVVATGWANHVARPVPGSGWRLSVLDLSVGLASRSTTQVGS